ncbi:MAG: YbfB/YjiJ family MFS transporter [Gemmatimonadales bacterium]
MAPVLLYGGTLMGFPAVVGALFGDLAGPDASRAMGFVNVFFSGGQMRGPFLADMVIDATATVGPALTVAAAVSTIGGVAGLIVARRLVAVSPAAIGG